MKDGTPSGHAGPFSRTFPQPVRAIRELVSSPIRVGLPRNRSSGPVHKRLHLLQGKLAIFVAVHCLENSFVSRLKLLQ